MRTEQIRSMLLTAFGNAFLNGKDVSYDNGHPAAYGLQTVKFVHDLPGQQIGWVNYLAKSPNEWFRYLKNEGYNRLYLLYIPNSLPDWKILALKEEKNDIWSYKVVMEHGGPKNFFFIEKSELGLPEIAVVSLEETKMKLRKILEEMIAFTISNELKNWQSIFERAKFRLSNNHDEEILKKGFLPEGCYKIEARQIISACDEAWVFGGMGSWNDIILGQNGQGYRQLTDKLYSTLYASLTSAINSYPS